MDTNLTGPVADALAGLRYEDRQILSMTFVEELNATQIGRRLGMKPAAVRKRKERLLKALAGSDQLRALATHEADDLDDTFDEAASYKYPDLVGF